MINVSVSTLVFGSGETQVPLPKVKLRLVSQRLSARKIIADAVREQMKELTREFKKDFQHVRRQLNKQYLNQADLDRQERQGKVALEKKIAAEPNVEREIERAIQAFKNRTYKMFVDGTEVIKLDEDCTLIEGSSVSFVRLIPLVGG